MGVGFGVSVLVFAWGGRAEAHSVPRPYLSAGPAFGADPAHATLLYGGTFTLGLGVDPERDALLFRCQFLTNAEGTRREPGPEGLVLGAATVAYRVFAAPDNFVVPFYTLGLGAGLSARGTKILPAFALQPEAGLRFGKLAALSVQAQLYAPVMAVPLTLSLEVGFP